MQWVNKLLDWTHDDFELQRFLQNDDSWPVQQNGQGASLQSHWVGEVEPSMLHYYLSDPRYSGVDEHLITYYKHHGDELADKVSFFGGVFGDKSIFARLGSSQSRKPGLESGPDTEPEPEPELEPGLGKNFIHSVFGRLSAFEKSAHTVGQSDSATDCGDGLSPTDTHAAVQQHELGNDKAASKNANENKDGDRNQPLIPVKRVKVASYQMRTDEKTGKEFTAYQVKCFPVDELATAPWVVSRRFSAFSDLRESLGSAIAKIPFPSRHLSLSLWGNKGK